MGWRLELACPCCSQAQDSGCAFSGCVCGGGYCNVNVFFEYICKWKTREFVMSGSDAYLAQ